jgi:acyl-CoA-binding protein
VTDQQPTPEEIAAADALIERARAGDKNVLAAILQHQDKFAAMKPHIEAARTQRAQKAGAELNTVGGYPWDNWDATKRGQMDKAVENMTNAQIARGAGQYAYPQHARSSAGAAVTGDLAPEEATLLARYKQYKDVTGGDPDWQGPVNMNAGATREAPDSSEDIAARNAAFFKASPEERSAIHAQMKLKNERAGENFYDPVTKPVQQPKVAPMVEQPITLAQRQRGPAEPVAIPEGTDINQKVAASLLNFLRSASIAPSGALTKAVKKQ